MSSLNGRNGSNCFILILSLLGVLAFLMSTEAAPRLPGNYYQRYDVQNPEYLLQTLARLRDELIAEEDLENTKRGLDLGLSRGFSGSQAAKHLMGLAAANFAGGPGRRRRSVGSNDDD